MTEYGCADVVRFGGDLTLAQDADRAGLAGHIESCPDCTTYHSQIVTTRDLLRRHDITRPDTAAPTASTTAIGPDLARVRTGLLERACLLDPDHADDLVQQSIEAGLSLQRKDSQIRDLAAYTAILHTLSDARFRFEASTIPAVDVTAEARARVATPFDLDADADTATLFYPDLYPGDDSPTDWVETPSPWRTGDQLFEPEASGELDEVYIQLDQALAELPEPLRTVLDLVDLQGGQVSDAAQNLGLDRPTASAALSRARNHVRGRLADHFSSHLTAPDRAASGRQQ